MSNKIQKATKRIEKIKQELSGIGPMRPGKLSQQQRKNQKGDLYGSYWQISYTYKMKSRSHYVPEELVPDVKGQTEEYRRFKALIEEWVDLALSAAQEELIGAKKKLKN
jgi:hypothetical protein